LADQNKTTVLLCLPPIRQELQEIEQGKRYLEVMKEYIEGICHDHHNVVLLTDDFYYVAANQIRDNANHLSAEESIVFTEMIAQQILNL
jgi:hypothetical protein